MLGGIYGGAWILRVPDTITGSYVDNYWVRLAVAVILPVVAEGLFRGLVHGRLAQHFRIQHSGGPWFLSWPVITSSALYALWTSLPFLPYYSSGVGLTFAAALLFGISSGMARERSESLLPCIILHWSCLLAFVVWEWLG